MVTELCNAIWLIFCIHRPIKMDFPEFPVSWWSWQEQGASFSPQFARLNSTQSVPCLSEHSKAMRAVSIFALVLSLVCAAFASGTVTVGAGAATTQTVTAQAPQAVVVVNPVPTTQSAVQTTVVEPVVQPTITTVPSSQVVNPAISTTTTELTVVDLPTPTQNIQCRASA
jgi:hypothetical protein